ncbi:MAG TPA: ATP-binding cassette domain-containing protein [Stackebrandtia sp.]|jgi:ABC-type lipoprotein export system ATPase subunit|uniref:ABC transporter ATP-binding protein n=1 Tax=Stackebrandtia sp. TaxID=2023065 RepID=UPI002D23B7BE|nr:ATP-binding cassette domain-containing protein [Stackebrandtia sp.]HZE40529.1 ATP-binding cassette domain-containing protein [Stackebrandtia sp.]
MSYKATEPLNVSARGLVYIYRLEGYDVVALSGVDLDIAAGESVGLVGPSGSGKSTLVSLMAGLLRPSAGRLHVGDHDLVKATTEELQRLRSHQIGMVLQGTERNLVPYLSARDNLRFARRGVRGSRRRDLPEVTELLSLVGLESHADSAPAELSPGQRQKLAVAVGLSGGAGLLLADEPTSQLDADARDEVLDALLAVHGAGHTVVIVTHDPEVGARMGRTVTIRGGRVGAEGRRGEDFLVVGTGGTVHLPPEITQQLPPGTLLRVTAADDGSVTLHRVSEDSEEDDQ